MKRAFRFLLPILVAVLLTGCQQAALSGVATPVASSAITAIPEAREAAPVENGIFTHAGDVSAYLNAYGRLPQNFITKGQARALGWSGGNLEPYAPGKTIGGDLFGNYEGLLPEKKGRQYYECDIDTLGRTSRGASRLVYSNDGLIYYTTDHYQSFTLLYGEDGHAVD